MIQKFFLIIGLVLLVSACNNQEPGFSTDISVPVTIEEVKLGSIQEVFTSTGTILSEYESVIQSEASGEYYLQINPRTRKRFKMGDKVFKGDLIIKIEDKEYENNVNIEGAEIDLEISQMEYEKQVALYEKGGVTLREKVNGQKQLVTAEKTYENAKIQLDKLEVRSPFNGVITDLPYFSQGVKINQGLDILQLMSYEQMVLDLMLPESQMLKVFVNQPAFITNYSIPNDTLSGVLKEISPAIDVDSRTFKGRIYVSNKDAKLRPGMFVKTDIVIDKKDSVVVIPKDAILVRSNGKAVFIAANETAREKMIVTGIESNGMVEVLEGLRKEERLIIKGFETLKDRSKVKVLNK
ncbi:efflux RND transporter periplasmic adaptor subunit [Labilibacter sediminis]|nr:efflux RND transporter periplasmic adaptor subunit [Labilibacter sediminis]